MIRFWIRRLSKNTDRPSVAGWVRHEHLRTRLRVEKLESREVPANFVVTDALDDGSAGCLRSMIEQANSASGDNTITFDPTAFATTQTITLSGSDLELSNATGTTTITGPTAGVIVSGAGASSVLLIDSGVDAVISGMSLVDGANSGKGGAVTNAGTLTLTGCNIESSTAEANGGGIASSGALSLVGCTVTGNSAPAGGGIYVYGGSTTLQGCTLTGNTTTIKDGGAVEDYGYSLSLTDCSITNNSSVTYGGGISGTGYDTMTLSGCTISGNNSAACGGIHGGPGTTALTDCTVSGNSATNGSGGGVATTRGTLDMTDCTISGNSASYLAGGCYGYEYGNVTMVGCTISGNSAGDINANNAGVYEKYGVLTMTNCTVSGNPGTGVAAYQANATLINCTISNNQGGIYLEYNASLTLQNTIVAGNSNSDINLATGGAIQLASNNLIGTHGSGGLTNGQNGNIVGVSNPDLGPLANNGGPTSTMALLTGSPAIGKGGTSGAPATDQRGFTRVPPIDIGAYQTEHLSITGTDYLVPTATTAAGLTNSSTGQPIVGTVITLTGTDAVGNRVDLTTTTNSSGKYTFSGLNPSNSSGYTITETVPSDDTHVGQTSTTSGAVTNTPPGTPAQVSHIVLTAGTSTDNFFDTPVPGGGIYAVSTGPGGGPVVQVYSSVTGALIKTLQVYNPAFRGGVTVCTADLFGFGYDDIITGAGPGGGPIVKIFDGRSFQEIASFNVFQSSFRGGISVAAGLVNGKEEIVVGAGPGGGPEVRIFDPNTDSPIESFWAYTPSSRVGVNVAVGDVLGDGLGQIITGAGPGGGPQVAVFNAYGSLLQSFYAYDSNFLGGITVSAGDLFGTGYDDIVTGTGQGGGPVANVFDGPTDSLVMSFDAFGTDLNDGFSVSASHLFGTSGTPVIIAGSGPGYTPTVNVFAASTLDTLSQVVPYDEGFLGGTRVG